MNSCEYEAVPNLPFLDISELVFEGNVQRGTSTVFLYKSKKDGKFYTVKQILMGEMPFEDIKQHSEICKLLMDSNHPNMVAYVSVCFKKQMIDGQPYKSVLIKMQHQQKNFLQYITERKAKNQQFTVKQIMNFIQQIVSVLGYLQKLGLAHRDIKPQNIYVQKNDDNNILYKITDFQDSILVTPKKVQNLPIINFQYSSYSLLKSLHRTQKQIFDPFKIDIFAFGLTVLKMCSMGRFNQRQRMTHIDSKSIHKNYLKQTRHKYLKLYKNKNLNYILKLMLQSDQFKRDNALILKIRMQDFEELQPTSGSSKTGRNRRQSTTHDQFATKQRKFLLTMFFIQMILFVIFSLY